MFFTNWIRSSTAATQIQTCLPTSALNWAQKAQLVAAQFYANLFGGTAGFGVGGDGGGGVGPRTSSWNVGGGGSLSTLIVADSTGNSGILNSAAGGLAFPKMGSPGSNYGGGFGIGPTVLYSPFSIDKIKGQSGSFSAGGGTGIVGGGFSISSSGALTVTAGWGGGAELSISPGYGNGWVIPFCKNNDKNNETSSEGVCQS